MNKALISFARGMLAITSLSLLTACGGGASNDSSEQGALAGAHIGGPFVLTDQDGKKVSWDSFKGKYRLVYFGYTYCPDVCPVDLQHITQAFTRFEKQDPARAAKVQPIFITVDPERDTPAVLKNYVRAFSPRLIGLTGTPDEIAKVAKDFVVLYGKEGGRGPKDYLVSHSRTPYLFDANGAPIALVPVDDPATPQDEGSAESVFAALDKWVK